MMDQLSITGFVVTIPNRNKDLKVHLVTCYFFAAVPLIALNHKNVC